MPNKVYGSGVRGFGSLGLRIFLTPGRSAWPKKVPLKMSKRVLPHKRHSFCSLAGPFSGLMEVLNGVQGSYKECELSGSLLHGFHKDFARIFEGYLMPMRSPCLQESYISLLFRGLSWGVGGFVELRHV